MLTVHILWMFLLKGLSPSTMYWKRKWITKHKSPWFGQSASVSLSLFKETFGSEPWTILVCGILSTASSGTEFGLWTFMVLHGKKCPGWARRRVPSSPQGHGVWFSLSRTHKTTALKARKRGKDWRLKELSACFTEIQKQLCNSKHIKVWVSPAFRGKTNPMVERYMSRWITQPTANLHCCYFMSLLIYSFKTTYSDQLLCHKMGCKFPVCGEVCPRPHYFSCYSHRFLLFYDSAPIFLNTAYFSSFKLRLPPCSHLLNSNVCSYSLFTFPPVGILLTSQTRYLGALLPSSHPIPHSMFSSTLLVSFPNYLCY